MGRDGLVKERKAELIFIGLTMTKRAVTLCVRTEAIVRLTDRVSTAEDL